MWKGFAENTPRYRKGIPGTYMPFGGYSMEMKKRDTAARLRAIREASRHVPKAFPPSFPASVPGRIRQLKASFVTVIPRPLSSMVARATDHSGEANRWISAASLKNTG